MVKNLEFTLLLDYYGDFLTEKQRAAIDLFYNEDLNMTEIGEQLNITRQAVRDAIKRSEDLLLQLESRIGLVAKAKTMNQTLQKFKDDLNNIASTIKAAYPVESTKLEALAQEF
ncbi:MAG: DNA-binding protein [Clostridiales bacterium]|jgi:predicted DNA-binding protein YlxM (UPF0122 family)|nr:DNA-binding protein [Clostridiales bacterium]